MKPENDIPRTPRRAAVTARRQRQPKYTQAVYGARLPREDARILDDYATAHHLDRSAVVRLAVRHFALRQQMKLASSDPFAKLVEEAVAHQIAPLQQVVAGLQPLLARLFQELFERLRAPR